MPGPGAGYGADPIWSEPESAPGPLTSGAGAAQKRASTATLLDCIALVFVWQRGDFKKFIGTFLLVYF